MFGQLGRLDVELETNVIVQEGDSRRHYVIGDSSATIDAEDNVINPAATGENLFSNMKTTCKTKKAPTHSR